VKAPGTWEVVGENGVQRPNHRLIEVGISYLPIPGVMKGKEENGPNDKMLIQANKLFFENRLVYLRGLGEITDELVLTMEQEWMRDDHWTARDGKTFSSIKEYQYVVGTASEAVTFAGIRDHDNVGMTLQDFVDRINGLVKERGEKRGMKLQESSFLSWEEVAGVRLYTGPAYQPLNNWLRNIGKLEPGLRSRMAYSPSLSYAATTKHIVSAIRKLAAVGHPELSDDAMLYRGLCGILPDAFWVKDQAGIVCATDLGFMSTSLAEGTPIHYMKDGAHNLLWQLCAKPPSDTAYHCGAVISELSQYSGEKECLFPPLTMLKVLQRNALERQNTPLDGVDPQVYIYMDGVDPQV